MGKKRVLILAYDFPPYNSIAAQRPASWLKYLKIYGVEPTVITFHWDREISNDRDYIIPSFNTQTTTEDTGSGKVIRVPFKPNLRDKILHKYGFHKFSIVRKMLTLYFHFMRFVLLSHDNSRNLYKEAKKALTNEGYDLIVATAEPFILFKYARLLSKTYKLPWIADYRDPWTNNHEEGSFFGLINKKFFRRLETKYVSTASYITTAAPSYKNMINEILDKDIEVIYNGSDVEGIVNEQIAQSTSFDIAYAGRIYPHQDLEVFLEAYKLFLDHYDGKVDSRLICYGMKFYHDNVNRILSYDQELNERIILTDRLPYEDLIYKLQESSILLLLSSSGADWLNAKIFDYLPLNRKIILVTNDHGILKNILDECNGGEYFDSTLLLKEKLIAYYEEFKENGKLNHHVSANALKYTRKVQAESLAKLINKCVE